MIRINARGRAVAALLATATIVGLAAAAPPPATAAQAQEGSDLYVRRRPPEVPNDPGKPAGVAGRDDTRVLGRTAIRSSAPMPITGGDVGGLLAIGLGAIGVGTALVRRGHRPA